jgi:hypothetical protein
MKHFLAGRRFLVTAALMALVAAPAMLLGPRNVRAFTLPSDIIYFDPISVPIDHTLHVNLVNEIGGAKIDFRTFVKPTTPAAGSSVLSATVTLAPGDGADLDFAFAGFSPPGGAVRVPVVAAIILNLSGGGSLPADWSGRIASSVEIVDDKTGQQTAILGGRHILRDGPSGGPTPCLFCN